MCDNVDKSYYPGSSNMNESVALIHPSDIFGLTMEKDYHGTKISDIDKVCDLDNLSGKYFPAGLGKIS